MQNVNPPNYKHKILNIYNSQSFSFLLFIEEIICKAISGIVHKLSLRTLSVEINAFKAFRYGCNSFQFASKSFGIRCKSFDII